MIASKWDGIWENLSNTFLDGLGHPYPPYARSSCAYWTAIDQDEAIVTGAISESEFNNYMAQFPHEPLKDKHGNLIPIELIQAALTELEEKIYQDGGPRPDATRTERVANKNKHREESFALAQAEYKQRNLERSRERSEQNAVFRLLEQVEDSLREAPSIHDTLQWEWLRTSVSTLTTTAHFENYPNWRARAWVACADLYRLTPDPANELLCLEHALTINNKLAIKRRIKKLQIQAE